jgi:hypothetical protein
MSSVNVAAISAGADAFFGFPSWSLAAPAEADTRAKSRKMDKRVNFIMFRGRMFFIRGLVAINDDYWLPGQ